MKRSLTIHEKNIDFVAYEDFLDEIKRIAVREFKLLIKKQGIKYTRKIIRVLKTKKTSSQKINEIDILRLRFQAPVEDLIKEYLNIICLFGLKQTCKELKFKYPKKLSPDINSWIKTVKHTAALKYLADVNSLITIPVVDGILGKASIENTIKVIEEIFKKDVMKKPFQILNNFEGEALFKGRDLAVRIFNKEIKLESGFNLASVKTILRREKVVAAQWCAIIDKVTCELCASLDGKIIDINSSDYAVYHPGGIHIGCRCFWVYIKSTERPENRIINWTPPTPELLKKYAKKDVVMKEKIIEEKIVFTDVYKGMTDEQIADDLVKRFTSTTQTKTILIRKKMLEFLKHSGFKNLMLKEEIWKGVKVISFKNLEKGVGGTYNYLTGEIIIGGKTTVSAFMHELGHAMTLSQYALINNNIATVFINNIRESFINSLNKFKKSLFSFIDKGLLHDSVMALSMKAELNTFITNLGMKNRIFYKYPNWQENISILPIKSDIVSNYSVFSAKEYIAEGIKFYVDNPAWLKAKDLELYNIVDKYFKMGKF